MKCGLCVKVVKCGLCVCEDNVAMKYGLEHSSSKPAQMVQASENWSKG